MNDQERQITADTLREGAKRHREIAEELRTGGQIRMADHRVWKANAAEQIAHKLEKGWWL